MDRSLKMSHFTILTKILKWKMPKRVISCLSCANYCRGTCQLDLLRVVVEVEMYWSRMCLELLA